MAYFSQIFLEKLDIHAVAVAPFSRLNRMVRILSLEFVGWCWLTCILRIQTIITLLLKEPSNGEPSTASPVTGRVGKSAITWVRGECRSSVFESIVLIDQYADTC